MIIPNIHNKEKFWEHVQYLWRVHKDKLISDSILIESERISWKLSEYPIPCACTGPDGEMFYSWDRAEHHLEVEIIEGAPTELFYRKRNPTGGSEETWFEEIEVGAPLPEKFISYMNLIHNE
jgi:hypothetical protein